MHVCVFFARVYEYESVYKIGAFYFLTSTQSLYESVKYALGLGLLICNLIIHPFVRWWLYISLLKDARYQTLALQTINLLLKHTVFIANYCVMMIWARLHFYMIVDLNLTHCTANTTPVYYRELNPNKL